MIINLLVWSTTQPINCSTNQLRTVHYKEADILTALQAVNIRQGDHIFIHSDMAALGLIEGAKTRQDYFQAFRRTTETAVGQTGTVVYPTFSNSFCKGEDFDPKTTKGGCGLLSELARKEASYIRSADPNFSITAKGAMAEYFTEKSPAYTFGEDAFFSRFLAKKGVFINFNFHPGFTWLTFIHHIERELDVAYRWDKPFHGNLMIEGKKQEATYYHYVRDLDKEAHLPDLTQFNALAKQEGWLKSAPLGTGYVVALTAENITDLIKKYIDRYPGFLIKGNS